MTQADTAAACLVILGVFGIRMKIRTFQINIQEQCLKIRFFVD